MSVTINPVVTRLTHKTPESVVDEIVDVVNAAYAKQNFRASDVERTNRAEINDLLKNRKFQLYVISEDRLGNIPQKIFGTIGLNTKDNTIGLFSVLPESKYKGQGKQLLEHAQNRFLVANFPKKDPLVLDVFPSQNDLIKYYEKNGFKPNGKWEPLSEENMKAIKPEYQNHKAFMVMEKEFPETSYDEIISKAAAQLGKKI